jgi:hypothetical protein
MDDFNIRNVLRKGKQGDHYKGKRLPAGFCARKLYFVLYDYLTIRVLPFLLMDSKF